MGQITAKELLAQIQQQLEEAGVTDAGFDGLQLFCHYTGFTTARLLSDGGQSISVSQIKALLKAVNRRCKGEPLQYILEEWEFYSLPFTVGPGVLIPRSETELLVDEALRFLENKLCPKVVDLCTGSGCIAISLAKNRADAVITAVDISEQAAAYFQLNRQRNQVGHVKFALADVLAGCGGVTNIDLITANPPYIPTRDLAGLTREVKREPRLALDGGDDGLVFYRGIIKGWYKALHEDGGMLFEVGIHQASAVAALLEEVFSQVYITPDLNGIPRVLLGVGKK